MTELVAVSPADVGKAWPAVKDHLQRIADSAPDLTLADLWRCVRSGDGELWLAGSAGSVEAVAVTRLREWGSETAAYIVGCSSINRTWLAVQPEFHAALKARGASKIIAEGRPGWARIWSGAKVVRHTYEVDLT